MLEVGSSSQVPRTGTAWASYELVQASHDVRADMEHREARKSLPVLAGESHGHRTISVRYFTDTLRGTYGMVEGRVAGLAADLNPRFQPYAISVTTTECQACQTVLDLVVLVNKKRKANQGASS